MKLLLVRHGEISSNINKVYAGRSPEKLTERGLVQAREVSEQLKKYLVHALYTSPVYRAIQTSEIIGEAIGLNFQIDEVFREIEMGPWEGLSEERVAELYPEEWRIWLNRPADLKLPGRETLEDLLKRTLGGIQKIYQNAGDKNIVIVTHVAVVRVLLLWHTKQSLNLYKTIHVPNAGVFEMKLTAF